MGKPAAVLLNKTTGDPNPSEAYAKANGLSIIASLPWDDELARVTSRGALITEESGAYRQYFSTLLATILKEAQRA